MAGGRTGAYGIHRLFEAEEKSLKEAAQAPVDPTTNPDSSSWMGWVGSLFNPTPAAGGGAPPTLHQMPMQAAKDTVPTISLPQGMLDIFLYGIAAACDSGERFPSLPTHSVQRRKLTSSSQKDMGTCTCA